MTEPVRPLQQAVTVFMVH